MVALDISNPTGRAHARLSASQSKRWMSCPGSSALIDELPEHFKRSGIHAERGTAAHTLVERSLHEKLADCRQFEGYWINQKGKMQRAAPVGSDGAPLDDGEEGWFIVDADMMDAVDVMVETVWAEMARIGRSAELSIERKFDLSWLRPEMFGTSDVSISQFLGELVVIDYKHGKGVPVEVFQKDPKSGKLKPNPQLAYYALGVAEQEGFTHETVTLIVVQPRCPHDEGGVRRFSFPMADLLAFRDELAEAADVVREAEAAYAAIKDPVEFQEWAAAWLTAGDHCYTSFCPKMATCSRAYGHAQEVAVAEFADDPYTLDVPTPEDGMDRLAHVLRWAKYLDAFVKAAKAHGMRAREIGLTVPDHKVIRGKSTRAFVVSEEEVVAAATAYVPKDAVYTTPKLKSPAQLEKLGKEIKKLVQGVQNPKYDPQVEGSQEWLIEPLAKKRPGKLTLVHVSQPGEEVAIDAASDFEDPYEDEGAED